jgi:hypothetical protein
MGLAARERVPKQYAELRADVAASAVCGERAVKRVRGIFA